ncbi:MAG: hypothetical protein DCF17_20425 [Shackletoniella antarctica]|uniref:Uncharacterized protein n=1 Tax=Shackletoniella antarctica TaxID=268115 RepID=A0A2W4XSN5_9CYAN|nr:MAG: hypothetical protein DCF17_20425 [Shackletoniella antarctica]
MLIPWLRVEVTDAVAVTETALQAAVVQKKMRLPDDGLPLVTGLSVKQYAAEIAKCLATQV